MIESDTKIPGYVQTAQETWYHEWTTIEKRKKELLELHIPLVESLGLAPLPTEFGDFTYTVYGDRTTGYEHNVFIYGDYLHGSLDNGESVLTRIHSACFTNETAHAINCECREEMHQALRDIARERRGILIYLQQEGRGNGVNGKLIQLFNMFEWDEEGKIKQRVDRWGTRIDTDRAYKQDNFPSECRDFSVAGEILHRLGVKSVRLMTNNPNKIKGVEDAGVKVLPIEIHVPVLNQIVASDLESKAKNLGHTIKEEQWAFSR